MTSRPWRKWEKDQEKEYKEKCYPYLVFGIGRFRVSFRDIANTNNLTKSSVCVGWLYIGENGLSSEIWLNAKSSCRPKGFAAAFLLIYVKDGQERYTL